MLRIRFAVASAATVRLYAFSAAFSACCAREGARRRSRSSRLTFCGPTAYATAAEAPALIRGQAM
jgi:hypothetical protein